MTPKTPTNWEMQYILGIIQRDIQEVERIGLADSALKLAC